MQGPSKTQRSALTRICLTMLGGGGAGSLGTLAVAHGPNATAAIAVGVGAAVTSVAAFAGTAIISLCAALPGIIAALPNVVAALDARGVARIKAKADAKVAREGARQRTALMRAGLNGSNLEAAVTLLKLQPLDADVLVDPRLRDDVLLALLPGPRPAWESHPQVAVMRARKPAVRPTVQKKTTP